MRRIIWVLSIFAMGSVAVLRADNWPHWRGSAMNGISAEKGSPLTWSETENVKWKTPLSGPGMSTPIVWGERVYLTQALDKAGVSVKLHGDCWYEGGSVCTRVQAAMPGNGMKAVGASWGCSLVEEALTSRKAAPNLPK